MNISNIKKAFYLLVGIGFGCTLQAVEPQKDVTDNYRNNRYPLLQKPLIELPLGVSSPKVG